MDDEDMLSPQDLLPWIFEATPDWHTLRQFLPGAQGAFVLGQAQNQKEYELALTYTKLKGLDVKDVCHFRYQEQISSNVDQESDTVDERSELQERYDREEVQFRENFFGLSTGGLKVLFALRVNPLRQQEAASLFINRLRSIDEPFARALAALQQELREGGQPVSCFLKGYERFESLVRRIAGRPSLELTDEKELTACLPHLEPWIRDHYVIQVGIMADDDEALVPEIEEDAHLLLFMMARSAMALLQPGDAKAASPYSTLLQCAKNWPNPVSEAF